MNRTYVTSSNLSSVGYDPFTGTLEVEFRNGSIYSYSGVPAHLYDGLMSAASHGSYFDEYIRKGAFPYRQLR